MVWSEHRVDGGVVHFNRETLVNVLRRGPSTAEFRRVAPRTLQVGLLTPCNLRCSFCYRDQDAPSRLTAPFLVDLLQKASAWGVLEVAFGGGEPLLFKGFAGMLRELHATTPLGLGFTTNGTLLTDAIVDELRGVVSEVRLSAYPDNGYRATLRRLRGFPAGVNWLVTPANVGLVEPYVADFLALGAKNVLLLGYKGDDASLHLDEQGLATLRRALHRLEGAPLRLDVCWHPHLRDVPQLFARGDCGAGDEFLVITPDRAVQACSFARTRRPFDTFEDLRRLYDELRAARPAAEIGGCTRSLFTGAAAAAPAEESSWVWQAAASNNSGDWTIAARFCSDETATRVADSLRELARAHEAFLASPEGQRWLEEREYHGGDPTPPLRAFGEAHGFGWTADGEGLWWEEDGCGAPVLTAGAVGDSVVVYHAYCMGLPEAPFRAFFERMGGTAIGYWQYDRPAVRVRARGQNADLERRMAEYLSLVRAAEYASEVKEPPPWGDTCSDPRVHEDEDRDARLSSGDGVLAREADSLIAVLSFNNAFAGALAFARHLSASGYTDVTVSLEAELTPLEGRSPADAAAPRTGLFGDVRPIAKQLEEASPEELVLLLLRVGRLSEPLQTALARLAPERVAELGLAAARTYWARGLDVTQVCVKTLEHLGPSPAARAWARALWDHLAQTRPDACGPSIRGLAAAVPGDEAFALVAAWCRDPTDAGKRGERLLSASWLRDPRCADLYEEHWNAFSVAPSVTSDWANAVIRTALPWKTARRWIERGRPFSLLALAALTGYVEEGAPDGFGAPDLAELTAVLGAFLARDPVPRVKTEVAYVLESPGAVTRK